MGDTQEPSFGRVHCSAYFALAYAVNSWWIMDQHHLGSRNVTHAAYLDLVLCFISGTGDRTPCQLNDLGNRCPKCLY
jgi:hypothetical protein